MTEADWLACADEYQMLELCRRRVSARRLRLFAVACCRGLWQQLIDPRSREGVEIAERLADGKASWREVAQARQQTDAAWQRFRDNRHPHAALAAKAAVEVLHGSAWEAAWETSELADSVSSVGREQARILRDIVGNPFRPVSFDPALRTPLIARLATMAYEKRILPVGILDRARLAVLADALEEGGCIDSTLLDHLRSSGPHVRGCWAVDLLRPDGR
jgi:hypothetical protein